MKYPTLPKEATDDWFQSLATFLELKDPLSIQYLKHALSNAQLFDLKEQDYGPGNVRAFGYFGQIVRMTDKFERLKTLVGLKKKAKNEKIEDTLRDIHVMCVIALMCHKGQWPS